MKYIPYSISKISVFKQCKKKFKYKYIDKIPIQKLPSKALDKGDLIHSILENIIKKQSMPTKTILYERYNGNLSISDIEECFEILTKFMKTNIFKSINSSPFTKKLEDWFYLDENLLPCNTKKSAILYGKIDFLIIDIKKQIGLIIDWKTGGKNKENILKYPKENSQLEVYSLWALQNFKLKGIKSKYYFIEHDVEQSLILTAKDLNNVKIEFKNEIDNIENCTSFIGNISKLCTFCDYKDICNVFNA